jgi:hypothetical protein
VTVAGVDAQQNAWPAAVRVDLPGRYDEALVGQLAGDVADRGGGQAGELAEFLAAEGCVEEQLRQQYRAVAPAKVADRAAARIHGCLSSG